MIENTFAVAVEAAPATSGAVSTGGSRHHLTVP